MDDPQPPTGWRLMRRTPKDRRGPTTHAPAAQPGTKHRHMQHNQRQRRRKPYNPPPTPTQPGQGRRGTPSESHPPTAVPISPAPEAGRRPPAPIREGSPPPPPPRPSSFVVYSPSPSLPLSLALSSPGPPGLRRIRPPCAPAGGVLGLRALARPGPATPSAATPAAPPPLPRAGRAHRTHGGRGCGR